MAKHVASPALANILAVQKNGFWALLQEGMLLFCSGTRVESRAIEDATSSPWSHVAMVIRVYNQWCVLESVWPQGVCITPIWQYVDRYPGDLVLASRTIAGRTLDQTPAILKGIELLGRSYAAAGLVKEGLHRLLPDLPAETNARSCYCSGLQWIMSQATAYPFPASPKGGAPAPEDLWTDPSVQPVAVLLYEQHAQGASQ